MPSMTSRAVPAIPPLVKPPPPEPPEPPEPPKPIPPPKRILWKIVPPMTVDINGCSFTVFHRPSRTPSASNPALNPSAKFFPISVAAFNTPFPFSPPNSPFNIPLPASPMNFPNFSAPFIKNSFPPSWFHQFLIGLTMPYLKILLSFSNVDMSGFTLDMLSQSRFAISSLSKKPMMPCGSFEANLSTPESNPPLNIFDSLSTFFAN